MRPNDIDRIWSTDTAFGGSDTIVTGRGNDIVLGGTAGDAITSGTGANIVIGDNALLTAAAFDNPLTQWAAHEFTLATIETTGVDDGGSDTVTGSDGNDVIIGGAGGDVITAGAGNDLVFGDQGKVTAVPGASLDLGKLPPLCVDFGGTINFVATNVASSTAGGDDLIYGGAGDDVILGEQGADVIYGEEGDDDIIGGSNVSGALDTGDSLDGGLGNDVIAGDNADICRTGSAFDPTIRALQGTVEYGVSPGVNDGLALVTAASQNNPTVLKQRKVTLLDHADTTSSTLYGNDYVAGGGGNDRIFGELGNDIIQGDGTIGPRAGSAALTFTLADGNTLTVAAPTAYTAGRAGGFAAPLAVVASFEARTDGDDYIEGNGGADVIFGNLGQDDLIGGSSNLFGLTTAAQRPDGSDLIFGGAGTDVARNDAGDTANGGHTRDADTIVGDNGSIFRLTGINGVGGANFLTFAYDNYVADADPATYDRIIPRVVATLDYTPGGVDYSAAAAMDRGAADELHGESGDDVIYGQTGADVLYGEGQDDDLIGGYGNDWISGGTGTDGIIGDDGRIFTSRNGVAEALFGITATTQQAISTPGNIQQATTDVTGQLKKTVNLTPFSVDPTWTPAKDEFDSRGAARPHNNDDIIFGGLGDDFLHGGSGDDAIGGGEALGESYAPVYDAATNAVGVIRSDYTRPVNIGNMLAFNLVDMNGQHNRSRAGEFALYDEYDPLRKILLTDTGALSKTGTGKEWMLNFSATEGPTSVLDTTKTTDGADRIFGDLGNDWIVGGTGRDNLYGGFGNDLLSVDDDLSTAGGLNNVSDTSASYEDRAYGGAGRDVLIANTGGDRLIDWSGEYNSYLVPFAPFGMATVSRTLQPQLMDFLYALSAADGADPTRAGDVAGADPARKGEPWGELGLVLQKDAAWKDQHGGPADPQAGNIGGTKRDVLRTANFADGTAQGFLADSGTWTVTNQRYQVAPSAATGDAVSVLYVDSQIPSYFEMQATINGVKPTGGSKSNAYLIFDYQGKTNFKFAGINVSNNRLEVGHRDATGWKVDSWWNIQLKSDTDYVVQLSANGSTATLKTGTTTLSYTFAPRVDSLGVSHGLSDGMVGIGTIDGKAQIDDVVVQKAPGAITLDNTVDFSTGPTALFNAPVAGTWVTTAGRYNATTTNANSPAIDLMKLDITAGSYVDLVTTLKTSGQGGIVFDYQGTEYYKFATLSADSRQVILGHRAGSTWVTDGTFSTAVSTSTDYKLEVTLQGGVVNVLLNGVTVLAKVFNETVTEGDVGLISRLGTTSGLTSFDMVQVRTDDYAFATPAPGVPLQAAAAAPAGLTTGAGLTDAQLAPAVQSAALAWKKTGLLSDVQRRLLDTIEVDTADLSGILLGVNQDGKILIDVDGGGYGWFIDTTPGRNEEFSLKQGELVARPGSAAAGGMDLVTAVTHEMGHALGLDHDATGDQGVMTETLATGVRRLPGVLAGNGGHRPPVVGREAASIAAMLEAMDRRGVPGHGLPGGAGAATVLDNAGPDKVSDFLNFGDRRSPGLARRADRVGDFLNFGAVADRGQAGKGTSALRELSRLLSHLK